MKIICAKKDDQIWQLSEDDIIIIKLALKDFDNDFSLQLLHRIERQEKANP